VLLGLDKRHARAFALACLHATTRHVQPAKRAARSGGGSSCGAGVSCMMRTLFPHTPETSSANSDSSSGNSGAGLLMTRREALQADARLLAAAARAYRQRQQTSLRPPSKGTQSLAEIRRREDPNRYVRSDPTLPRCRGYTFEGPSIAPERRLSPTEMGEFGNEVDDEGIDDTSDPTLPRCPGYVFVKPPLLPAPDAAADWFATVTAISDSSESGSSSDLSSRADSSSVNGSSANSSPAPRVGAEPAKRRQPPRHKSPSSARNRPPPPRVAAPGSRRKGNTSSSLDRPTPEKGAQSPSSSSATDALLEAAALDCAPLSLSGLNERFDGSSHLGPADRSLSSRAEPRGELRDESSVWSTPGSSAMNTSANAGLGDSAPSGWASPGRFENGNGRTSSGRNGPTSPSSLDVTL
jgi:hypothetical protein